MKGNIKEEKDLQHFMLLMLCTNNNNREKQAWISQFRTTKTSLDFTV